MHNMDHSGKMQRKSFSTQLSCFLLLCLFMKGDVVWGECSLDGMEIQGGNFTLSNGQNEGSVLRYQCPKGFYPYPELAHRCQLSDQWTPQNTGSRCRKIECPDPNVFRNGYIPPPRKRRYFYDNEITYHCYSGYTLHGPQRRTCLENGKWSGSNPVCRTDYGDCPDPGVPPGGKRSGNRFDIGDKVTFKCNSDDMILMGSEERECQINGHWSGTEPSCYYKHTYDNPWEVTEAFGGDIKNTLASNLINKTQQERSIMLTRNGTLNIFIALDVSESIDETDFQNAKTAIMTLITKIEAFSVYPRYEVVFFSSKIQTVIDILDFYGPNDPPPLWKLLQKFEEFEIEREDKYGTNIKAVFEQFEIKLGVIKEREKHRFRGHHHVIILFTDGGYNTGGDPSTVVKSIKSLVYMNQPHQRQEHLDIYVFGIGAPIYDENLKPLVVGTGGKSHYYRLTNLEALQETFDEIIDESDIQGRCGLYQGYGEMYTLKEKRKKFPWAIHITVKTDNTTECSGSLVSPRFVLTAAHCFNSKNYDLTVAVPSDRQLGVKAVHIHPNYNVHAKVNRGVGEFYDFDVALIELSEDVPISKSLRPICLPCTDETKLALRQPLTCNEQEHFLLKNKDRVTFLTKKKLIEKAAHVKLGGDRDHCIKQALKAPKINTTDVTEVVTENFLCTGGRSSYLDKVACKGESGGAVFKNYKNRTIQVALVSWGTKHMPRCDADQLADSDDDSRDYHINLFKVLPFLKLILGNTTQNYAPLVFVE